MGALMAIFGKPPWSRRMELSYWADVCMQRVPGRLGVLCRNLYFGRKVRSMGKRLTISERVRVQKPAKLTLGDDVRIDWNAHLNASGEVSIVNRVRIGPWVRIWSDNHLFSDSVVPLQQQGFEFKPVILEDDVVIGARSFIKPGVRIGRGTVVLPGTILSKSVPEFSLVGGNPGTFVSRNT
jgi:acetyltransferase-like isoleucine patch superfamily enzyme